MLYEGIKGATSTMQMIKCYQGKGFGPHTHCHAESKLILRPFKMIKLV
jgi:hypothetical protein